MVVVKKSVLCISNLELVLVTSVGRTALLDHPRRTLRYVPGGQRKH